MEKQKDTFLLAALIFAVVTWAFQLIFFWVLVKFRCYLMEQQGIVVALAKPEFHTSTVTTAHVRPSLNNNHQIHNEPMAFTMENPNMQDFQ